MTIKESLSFNVCCQARWLEWESRFYKCVRDPDCLKQWLVIKPVLFQVVVSLRGLIGSSNVHISLPLLVKFIFSDKHSPPPPPPPHAGLWSEIVPPLHLFPSLKMEDKWARWVTWRLSSWSLRAARTCDANVTDDKHRFFFYSIQYEHQNDNSFYISHDLTIQFKVKSAKVYSPKCEELKSTSYRFNGRTLLRTSKSKSVTFHGQFTRDSAAASGYRFIPWVAIAKFLKGKGKIFDSRADLAV